MPSALILSWIMAKHFVRPLFFWDLIQSWFFKRCLHRPLESLAQEATDCMNDSSKTGRWLSFNITSLEDLVIAEADRKLGDHIKSLSTFNKALHRSRELWLTVNSLKCQKDTKETYPISRPNNIQFQILLFQVCKLSELLRSLENAGEIGVSIGLHSIEESVVKGTKPCCFLLDPPKEKTLQKKVRLGQYVILKCQILALARDHQ